MRNESFYVAAPEVIALKDVLAAVGHLTHGKFENCLAILMDEVHLLVHSFVRRRIFAAAARHIKRAGA